MRKLTRSSEDRVLVGICGGFAEYFNLDPTLVRIVWLLFTFFSGVGLVAYGLALFFIPEKPGTDFSYHPREVIPGKESPWSYVLFVLIILALLRGIPLFGGIFHLLFFGLLRLIPVIVVLGILYWVITRRNADFSLQKVDWHLSNTDRLFLGVCGGLGEALNLEPVIIRIIWALGCLFIGPIGIILYFLAYYFLSKKPVIHE